MLCSEANKEDGPTIVVFIDCLHFSCDIFVAEEQYSTPLVKIVSTVSQVLIMHTRKRTFDESRV